MRILNNSALIDLNKIKFIIHTQGINILYYDGTRFHIRTHSEPMENFYPEEIFEIMDQVILLSVG